MRDIKVYIKKGCPWCIELENFLREKGVEYEAVEVLGDPAKFEEMVALSGQSKAPTVLIGAEIFADTDKEAMEKILAAKGLI